MDSSFGSFTFKHRGFTLVEILVVCALLSVLTAIGLYVLKEFSHRNRSLTRRQNFQNIAEKFIRELRKDMRSAVEASFSKKGIKLKIYQISESGIPEPEQINYSIDLKGIARTSPVKSDNFRFKNKIGPDDFWNAEIHIEQQDNSGVVLELFAVSSDGNEIFKTKERLIKFNKSKAGI
ncbi:MAG: type II secretion system protein [Candidatus Rifleibacteriota bacterium]